jgi:aryl-alcohol dehydrogenase-like predicted oxidoreductase
MELRRLGQCGLVVSSVGLGTMTWGRDTDEHEAGDLMREFVSAGGTLIDTAGSYADGDAERVIGGLLSRTVARDDLIISAKTGLVRRSGRLVVDASRSALLDGLDGSLRRLGVNHLDLWQLQDWCPEVPWEESLAAIDHALATGRVRYVGVSNYCGWQTALAVTHQKLHPGAAPLVATQVEYSLLARGVEREVLPVSSSLGLGVVAWSPLGRGVLTGKYRRGVPADSRAASDHLAGFVEHYLDARGRRIVDAVVTAAEGLEVSPADIALAWVRDRPGVSSAVVGARTAAQLRGTLAGAAIRLPAEIRSALDDVSAVPMGYPEIGRSVQP